MNNGMVMICICGNETNSGRWRSDWWYVLSGRRSISTEPTRDLYDPISDGGRLKGDDNDCGRKYSNISISLTI